MAEYRVPRPPDSPLRPDVRNPNCDLVCPTCAAKSVKRDGFCRGCGNRVAGGDDEIMTKRIDDSDIFKGS